MDDRPIFIGGLSQSGKTELRVALGAHPSIELTRHTAMWDRFYGRYGELGRARNLDRCLRAISNDRRVRALGPDLERIRREFREGPASYARLFGLIHRHHAERAGKPRWGEQLGFIERYADPIFGAFPSARIVHMIRDPRTRWRLDRGSRRRPGSLGWETARWLRSAELADRNRRRYGDRYRTVRYEAFAADPVSTLNDVCAFVEEICTPTVLDALASIRFDPPDGTRAFGSSLRARSTEDAFVERQARDALSAFGYASASTAFPPGEGAPHRPVDRAAMTAWRLLEGRGPVGARG